MPGGDRTGPLGNGPMTGRGAGYCGGYSGPGYTNNGFGAGFGRGFGGRGRGRRNAFFATGLPRWARGFWGYAGAGYSGEITPESEVELLKTQSEFFRKQVEVLNERIQELEEIVSKKGGA